MIEIFIIVAVVFFIAVLFYKQANEQFDILQITADRLEELPTLYAERSPIVVSGFVPPALGTEAELRKRTNIIQMTVSQGKSGKSLRQLLDSPGELRTFQFLPETASFLAQESGLTVWFNHHLYEQLLPSQYTKWFYSNKSSLWIDHRGLFKTTAFQTIIMPTQGITRVCLMLPSVLPYLPTQWEGRRFSSLSPQDTPLLNQIKYIEIRLRKGNLLALPPHMIVDVSSEEGVAWNFIGEIHHPISKISG
jgi:hypothetical protein